MATTLAQYWTDEVARLTARSAAQAGDVAAQRTALTTGQAAQVAASDAVRVQNANVDAARKALSGIAMPADGDPLLTQMELSLVSLAEAQASLASANMAVQSAGADLARKQAVLDQMKADLANATSQQAAEIRAAAARKATSDRLLTGDLSTLAADATASLSADEANARSRVEGEFPTDADPTKNMLARIRARRDLIANSLKAAAAVETAAFTADSSALAQAQRAFEAAATAANAAAASATQLAADKATLARLAALPAATATTFPILTPDQHARLFDAAKLAARETALAKLTAYDNAEAAARTAQQAYDTALYAAQKADPDKSQPDLDAGPLTAEKAALDTANTDLANARNAMTASDLATVKVWFANVPQKLYDELDALDTAIARLTALAGPPTPATLVNALGPAETALAAALENDRLAMRKQAAADLAEKRASAAAQAERDNAAGRARAYSRSAALF